MIEYTGRQNVMCVAHLYPMCHPIKLLKEVPGGQGRRSTLNHKREREKLVRVKPSKCLGKIDASYPHNWTRADDEGLELT